MWTEVKRRLKSAWAALGVALLALGAAAALLLGRRRERQSIETDTKIDEARDRIAAANARAAIEIHVARAKDETVRAELADIAKDRDGQRKRQRLLELERRVRTGQ